jgi:hypothetical protein
MARDRPLSHEDRKVVHNLRIEGRGQLKFCILARIEDGLGPLVLETEVARMNTCFLENYVKVETEHPNYVRFYYFYPSEFLLHQIWARGVPRSNNEVLAAEKDK